MDAKREYLITSAMLTGVFDFDPDQPRDENGRWTDTGGGGAKAEIPEEAKEIIRQLKLKKMLSKYNPGTYASYSEERILSELHNSMATFEPDYAQDYIAWVDPNDYLYATTTSTAERDTIKLDAGDLDTGRLQAETQPIYLRIDMENESITGHEGRHRMAALAKAGVEKVPVIISPKKSSYDRYNTKPIRMQYLDG